MERKSLSEFTLDITDAKGLIRTYNLPRSFELCKLCAH